MDDHTAREFLRFCLAVIGNGFHIDTPFHDYIQSGLPLFNEHVGAQLDALLGEAVVALADAGDDPYGVTLALMAEAA